MSAHPPDLEALVAAIAALSPQQRRKLQRRLHTSGLFDAEDLLTDQNKLNVAPAVAPRAVTAGPRTRPPTAAQSAAPASPPATAAAAPAPAQSPLVTRVATAPGKVVLGAPQRSGDATQPHAMAPLPGQAPDQPIVIVFDGGSRGNPGEGYGSYQMRWPGSQPQVVRLRFADNMTSNEAEYDTLIAALDAVLNRLREGKIDASTARLDVRGDSMLVIKQVLGEWKCKDGRMEARRDQVRARLRNFGEWRLTHHDRENSVRALGH